MMSSHNNDTDTATGASETPEPADGGRCSPQASKSPQATINEDVSRQASDANKDVGNVTVVESEAQARDGGKDPEATSATALIGNKEMTAASCSKDTLRTSVSERLHQSANLTEDQLLNKLKENLQFLSNYTLKTRNVHKEVKEKVANTIRVYNCYVAAKKKKTKMEKTTDPDERCSKVRPVEKRTKDAETSTPCWWEQNITTEVLTREETQSPRLESQWSEVIGRKPKRRPPEKPPPLQETIRKETNNRRKDGTEKTQRQRIRPCVVLVDRNSEAFPELVKRIRTGVNQEIIGDKIASIKQAKNGGAIIQIRGGQEAAKVVRGELLKTTDEAYIKTKQHRGLIEIRDMDVLTTKDELTSAVSQEMGLATNDVSVINLRKTYGETQTGLVLIPIHSAIEAHGIGRIKIGLVYCKVRQCQERVRCYRCLGYGHESRNCHGNDRRGCCNKCGKEGHFAQGCNAEKTEVERFRTELAVEAARFTTEPIAENQC